MSNLVEYARDELTRAGVFDKDSDYEGMLGEAVLELVEKFAEQGHSGLSALLTVEMFNTVARYRPLTPLTSRARHRALARLTQRHRDEFKALYDEEKGKEFREAAS